ncbi:MAG: peptide chain release factor N(5)-glutamine methyltransferase [Thermoanaerobaculales bacterium]|jgi:release factor glutamine methyltransferase|nr:peptide chain release factor N(5)-glutamine methyltransferase [Thermoanaerobaculales bacterium]
MTTTAEALELGARSLPRRRGIPDPRREAVWLLARAWGVDEVSLRIHPEREVPAEVEARYRGWLQRRAAGEPAHHLTGSCEFWGRGFAVSPAVLVPRPETELVVQVALELPVSPTARVLDVGTGSGCLAVTLAAERPRWRVTAVDRSEAALEVARKNAGDHGVEVDYQLGDLTEGFEPPWDLVVANLPYIPTADLAGLAREVSHDPASALDGGADGLDLIRRLIADLPRILRVCGGAVLELGEDQADAVAKLASSSGLGVARRITDPGGCERIVVLQPR